MTCGGHHIKMEGIIYCVRFPPDTQPPISEGDLIVTDVRRWLEGGPAGCHEPPVTQETVWVEGGFQPYSYFDIPPLILGFRPPHGRPARNEVQVYRLPICRDWPGETRKRDPVKGVHGERYQLRMKRPGKWSLRKTEKTEHDWRVTSTSTALEAKVRQVVIAPAEGKVKQGGTIEVTIDGSPTIVRSEHLHELLKNPLLKLHSPTNVTTAFEALAKRRSVIVDWEDAVDSNAPDETSTTIDWVRIVPRIKPNELDFFITEQGHLSSRLPKHAVRPAQERKTITRPAILYEEQRKELRAAVLGDGWPCRVVDGKIVVELFGSVLHLDQEQIRPKPVERGVHARIKVRELGDGEDDWLCHPMAATAEASWVINRYELLFEYKRLTRRYEPFAVRIDSDWRNLFGFLVEALTYGMDRSKDARLFFSPKRGNGDDYELQREIFTRLYDGGARFPLTPLGEGLGEYPFPGGTAAYARRGVHKSRMGVIVPDPEEHGHKETIHGPALYSGVPHDMLMDAHESSETDIFDGLHFAVCPSGKTARTTHYMAPTWNEK